MSLHILYHIKTKSNLVQKEITFYVFKSNFDDVMAIITINLYYITLFPKFKRFATFFWHSIISILLIQRLLNIDISAINTPDIGIFNTNIPTIITFNINITNISSLNISRFSIDWLS